jgi:hypothetical protein
MIQEALAYYHSLHGADSMWSIEPHGIATDQMIAGCELTLGHSLPPSFEAFAKSTPFFEYRFLSLRPLETRRPTLVGLNQLLHAKRPSEHVLPKHLTIFQPSWDGICYCFDTSKKRDDGEYPISYLCMPDHESILIEEPTVIAASFEDYVVKYFSHEWNAVFSGMKKRRHQKRNKPIHAP